MIDIRLIEKIFIALQSYQFYSISIHFFLYNKIHCSDCSGSFTYSSFLSCPEKYETNLLLPTVWLLPNLAYKTKKEKEALQGAPHLVIQVELYWFLPDFCLSEIPIFCRQKIGVKKIVCPKNI